MYILITLIIVVLGILFHFRLIRQKTDSLKLAIEDLKLIQEISRDISSTLDFNDLPSGIMDAFIKAGKVSKGSLMLFNEDSGFLEIAASIGLSERAKQSIKLRIGEGIAGKAAQLKKSLLIEDVKNCEFYKEFARPERNDEKPNETILSLPLIFQDQVLGVVTLDSKISGERFIRNDETLLYILASQAAVALNNSKMYEMAITDGLTKLYIKKYFIRRLEQEFSAAKRYSRELCLIFLDIDSFKKFNDTNGHQVGDQLLVQLSECILKITRASDVSARYGGDEFVIILPETKLNQAVVIAERLREIVSKNTFKICGEIYMSTVSIGVAELDEKMENSEDLINLADKMLYTAKNKGRNTVVSSI